MFASAGNLVDAVEFLEWRYGNGCFVGSTVQKIGCCGKSFCPKSIRHGCLEKKRASAIIEVSYMRILRTLNDCTCARPCRFVVKYMGMTT